MPVADLSNTYGFTTIRMLITQDVFSAKNVVNSLFFLVSPNME